MESKDVLHLQTSFHQASKMFLAHLQGLRKSPHTVKGYRLDLAAFCGFLRTYFPNTPSVLVKDLDVSLLQSFKQRLMEQQLSSNTQRRQLLTVSVFFRFCAQHSPYCEHLLVQTTTPRKKEYMPHVVSWSSLYTLVQGIDVSDMHQLRNKIILQTLVETACLVSEVCEIRWEDWTLDAPQAWLQLRGKNPRSLRVSKVLGVLVEEYFSMSGFAQREGWMFVGATVAADYNMAMTPRAIEMMVKHYALVLHLPDLTPRIIRHSRAFYWLQQGMSPNTLKDVLGLRTSYALKGYLALYEAVKEPVALV